MNALRRLFSPPRRDLAYVKALHQDAVFNLHLMDQQGVASDHPIRVRWEIRAEVLGEILGLDAHAKGDAVVNQSAEWLAANMALAERAQTLKELGAELMDSPGGAQSEFARGVRSTWAIVVRHLETGDLAPDQAAEDAQPNLIAQEYDRVKGKNVMVYSRSDVHNKPRYKRGVIVGVAPWITKDTFRYTIRCQDGVVEVESRRVIFIP